MYKKLSKKDIRSLSTSSKNSQAEASFSLKCSKLLFCLKLFGLMHVDMHGTESASKSLFWIVYPYLLICISILALFLTLVNMEVNNFNIRDKSVEHKFVIVFVSLIIFHVAQAAFIVTSLFFSMQSNVQRLLLQIFTSLNNLHHELYSLKRFSVNTAHVGKFWPVILHLTVRVLVFDALTLLGDPEKAFIKSRPFYLCFEVITLLTYMTILLHDLFLVTLMGVLCTYFRVIGDVLLELGRDGGEMPGKEKWAKGFRYLRPTRPEIFFVQDKEESENIYMRNLRPVAWAQRVPLPPTFRSPLSALRHCILLHYTTLVTARRVNTMFNAFMLSSVTLSFVAVVLGCFVISLFAILLLEDYVSVAEAVPPIGLSIIHSFTIMFFLYRMVQGCASTKEAAERVLHCAAQVAVECKNEPVSTKIRQLVEIISQEELYFSAAKFFPVNYNTLIVVAGTIVTYWIILIQLQVILLKI